MTTPAEPQEWTNTSVQAFAGEDEPFALMSSLTSRILLAAADAGSLGVPTDPFKLAELLGIDMRPHYDIADARLLPTTPGAAITGGAPLAGFVPAGSSFVIEYNPTRPRGRLRYSVAHEIAHALFPDAHEDVRNRTHTGAVESESSDDSWQLELLCNVGAAELLMPSHAIEGLLNSATDIDFLMAERAKFNVSTEALLRRFVHATERPVALAAFNRPGDRSGSLARCEYVLGSRAWSGNLSRGDEVEFDAFMTLPTAVGQTTRGRSTDSDPLEVQMVGVPPYPGRHLPRLLALLEHVDEGAPVKSGLTFVTEDIAKAPQLSPNGARVIVAHVVNDEARAWGRAGVAGALRTMSPQAERAFHHWSIASAENLTLGNLHVVDVPVGDRQVGVASLVAQRGFGPSDAPRLSYVALAESLLRLADVAERADAAVHMPRIGAGQAGGRWDLVEATIEQVLLPRGIEVVVYTKPSTASPVGASTGGAS